MDSANPSKHASLRKTPRIQPLKVSRVESLESDGAEADGDLLFSHAGGRRRRRRTIELVRRYEII